MEALLAPMYDALPKNHNGRLDHPTVRFALHRLFSKHGLLVQGLDVSGGAWNKSSPVEVVSGQIPSHIEASLEDRLNHDGFGLHELAVLAAAMKHLFSTEATQRLEAAYKARQRSVEDAVRGDEVYDLLDTYMAIYILDGDVTNASWVMNVQEKMHLIYPGWNDTQVWLHDTRKNLAYFERDITNPFAAGELEFEDVLYIVEEVNEQYGVAQDVECKELRDKLLEFEHQGTGRVRLADFYGSKLNGAWQFSESAAYLRQLGALDESDPKDPRVVVPNYLYSKTNCVAKSSYYSVCCINECEGIQEHIERALGVPQAEPQNIADVVAQISSSTVSAPRNLSHILLQRLDEVAAQNSGKVQLHGRLFAQWLHHAYPRECPYPHVSGTTNPLTSAEWIEQTGTHYRASNEELSEHASRASWHMPGATKTASHEEVAHLMEELLPWNPTEELVHSTKPEGPHRSSFFGARYLLVIPAFAAVVFRLVRALLSARVSIMGGDETKCYV